MRKVVANFFGERQGTILQVILGSTIVLFIAILVGSYIIARHANPILLDEKGIPIQAEGTSQNR